MSTDVIALTSALFAALQHVRHYGLQHPAAEETIQRLEAALQQALREAALVRWDVSPDWLIVQGTLLPDDDRHALPLRQYLTARRVARLTMSPQAEGAGLRRLIRLLAREPEELIAEGGLAQALRALGVAGIEVEGPDVVVPLPRETDDYRAAVAAAAALVETVERGDRVDVGRVRLVVEPLAGEGGDLPALWAQVALRGHDELDPPHAVNVAFLAIRLGQALGLAQTDQIDLGVAAFLHDIGMARLPWAARLQERTHRIRDGMPRHAIEGAMLLRHLGGRASLPMLAALEHHRVITDGARDLPPHAGVVALADYLDALTCGRSSGVRPSTVSELMSTLLAGRGPQFDAMHVRALGGVLARAEAAGADFAGPG